MSESSTPLSERKRLMIGAGIFLALVLTLGLLYWTVLRDRYVPLYTGLSQTDAAFIIETLEAEERPFKVSADGTTILVPSRNMQKTRLGLVGSDLSVRGASGFELFDTSELGLTGFAQQIKYQRALQGELSRTLSLIDGVDVARVHIAFPNEQGFGQTDRKTTASVTLVTNQSIFKPNLAVPTIRLLVASSVPELNPENVAVLGTDAEVYAQQGLVVEESVLSQTNEETEQTLVPVIAEETDVPDVITKLERNDALISPASDLNSEEVLASFQSQPNSRFFWVYGLLGLAIGCLLSLTLLVLFRRFTGVDQEVSKLLAEQLVIQRTDLDSEPVEFSNLPETSPIITLSAMSYLEERAVFKHLEAKDRLWARQALKRVREGKSKVGKPQRLISTELEEAITKKLSQPPKTSPAYAHLKEYFDPRPVEQFTE